LANAAPIAPDKVSKDMLQSEVLRLKYKIMANAEQVKDA
jgi:hypothetical protein